MAASLQIILALLCGVSNVDEGPHRLEVEPARVRLVGPESQAQIVVSPSDGVVYECSAPVIAAVDRKGRIRAVGNGSSRIRVSANGETRWVDVEVAEASVTRPVDFVRDVIPTLTRLGCNAGNCHGKSTGQNGFRLSLLGFEPGQDYVTLVRDSLGRRVSPLAPRESLMLRKPAGLVAHGGGRRLAVDSPEYQTIVRWIGQGMPYADGSSKRAARLEVRPNGRRVRPGSVQQLRAVVFGDDGSEVDVTRLARFESNTLDLAEIDEFGRVTILDGSGEAVILARYDGGLGVARLIVPREANRSDAPSLPPRNFVDEQIDAKLQLLGLPASPPAEDFEFARRSSLDILGILPSAEDVKKLQASHDPEKRIAWIDRLLERPEYADRFAMLWSAVLRNRRTLGPLSQPGTFAFHAWIREAIAENRPYDQFMRAILTAQGDSAQNPSAAWLREPRPAEAIADDAAQLFMGVRLQCARCHHHPYERWSQDDSARFSGLFRRIGRKPGVDAYSTRIFVLRNEPGPSPRVLEGPDLANPMSDPREDLADWLARRDNPYFARAVVNRYWKQFFGRGLVDPEDDLRASNPPSHPELLDMLADDFVRHGYDLKRLIRTIATSRTYERSSAPVPGNETDRRNLARFPTRRMPAEVLLDAIDTVAGTSEAFAGLPKGFRAVQLPDEGFDTSARFLDIFGRPKRESACECERSAEPSLSQELHLLNSLEIERKVGHPEGRAARWSAEPGDDGERIETLYRNAFSRDPDREEKAICLAYLKRKRSENAARKGLEDLIWTIINTKEFQFIR